MTMYNLRRFAHADGLKSSPHLIGSLNKLIDDGLNV